MYLVSKQSKR